MNHKKIIFIATLLLALELGGLQAQQTTVASGGEALGSGGSVSYTVGQVAYSTSIGTNGSVAQGVQQAYKISEETGIENTEISLDISAYPNPTSNYLSLKVDASTMLSSQSMSYQLYNMQGKLLKNSELTANETQIDMSGLVSSTYFVKVADGNKELKTFKIIKTQ